MTTAFVLSGGGSLGAVQVGMLRALAQKDVMPDFLVGTSAGALNAGFLAGRGLHPQSVDELARVWVGLKRSDLFPIRPMRTVMALAGRLPSLCSNQGIKQLIARRLDYENLEDATIPVHVIATDVLTGMEACFSTGDAASAILASCALPGIYPPVQRGPSTYVDGGLADNAAISQAVALGADIVYVLPSGNACALKTAPKHTLAIAMQALTLLIQHQLIRDTAYFADKVDLRVVPPLCPLAVPPLDFGHAEQLIERAYLVTAAWLESEHTNVEHPENVLALHKHRD
ncbi:MAG: patatin-like phospholipase family protein [Nakamurella sp.]